MTQTTQTGKPYILPAPAKLNLNLTITGRRADGMHLLQSVMVPIDFCDTVTLTPRSDGVIARDWSHPQVSEADDLTLRAARALRQAAANNFAGAAMPAPPAPPETSAAPAASIPGVTIAVEKRIPVGGGLGGGSSNAAAVLRGLNELWRLNFAPAQLAEIAAGLGADIPFFLRGAPAVVSGIGDVFCDKKADINNYLLTFPPVCAITKKVFARYADLIKNKKTDKITPPLDAPWDKSDNDLTAAAVSVYPALTETANFLYKAAGEARLSGSGSTIFAMFGDRQSAAAAQRRLPARVSSRVVSPLREYPAQRIQC